MGNNIKVNDELEGDPSISIDGSGNFTITWADDSDIYAQRYSSDGVALGAHKGQLFDIWPFFIGTLFVFVRSMYIYTSSNL